MKIDKHIEIVRSDTAFLSSMGTKSADMIRGVLQRHYNRVEETFVSDIHDLDALVGKRPDLVFIGMKNIPAQNTPAAKIWLSEHLEDNGLNYTGSVGTAIALDFDKSAAKQIVQMAGLNTSAYFVARAGQYKSQEELPLAFPLFVKPPNGGGGKGIGADSVVRDFAGFQHKVKAIAIEFQTDALVETYLPGREFSVALLDTLDSDGLVAMPIELVTEQNANGDRILGQKVKSADTEHVILVQNESVRSLVMELATDVFKALGARDYGRIDIRLDEQGVPHFLEANLVPGLAHHDFISYFTSACWLNQHIDYEAMILKIVELGLARNEEMNILESELPTTHLKLAFEA